MIAGMLGVPLSATGMAQPAPPATTAAVVAPFDARYAIPAPGSWSYAASPGGSDATFSDDARRPLLVVHCTRATRQVNISRVTAAASSVLAIWTSTASRTAVAGFDPLTLRVTARFASYDLLLDAIAFSHGRFSVSSAGTTPLVLPAWPEPARAVEDCRI